jgi:hypothetical protein
VLDPQQVRPGDLVITRVAHGRFSSVVASNS